MKKIDCSKGIESLKKFKERVPMLHNDAVFQTIIIYENQLMGWQYILAKYTFVSEEIKDICQIIFSPMDVEILAKQIGVYYNTNLMPITIKRIKNGEHHGFVKWFKSNTMRKYKFFRFHEKKYGEFLIYK